MFSIIPSRTTLFLLTTTALSVACSDSPTAPPRASAPDVAASSALVPKPGAQGHIVYSSPVSGERHIYLYDPATLTTKRLTDNVGGGNTDPSISPDGKRVVWLRFEAGLHLYAINVDGSRLERLTTQAEPNLSNPSFSPDMKRVLVTANNASTGVAHLHLFDLKTRQFIPIGDPNKQAFEGDWSPDGKRIVYVAQSGFRSVLFTMNADGTNAQELVTACVEPFSCRSPRWSPDGSRIAFEVLGGNGIWVYRVETNSTQSLFLLGEEPMWSPDGTRIGFHRKSAVPEEATIFTARYPAGEPTEQVLAGLQYLYGTSWGK